MPIKGRFTAGACVLFERPVSLEQLNAALAGFDVVNTKPDVTEWALGGPSVTLAFRPNVNGLVVVDTVDRPWPDHMGDPKNETKLFGAWSMGHFGPFAFPGGLKRAAQQSWGWEDGKTAPERHSAFVRILASYVLGPVSGDAPIFPPEYDPLEELNFVTLVALTVAQLPGAVCYFNPNGESLRDAATVENSLQFAEQNELPPLDVWCNVRLFNVGEGWLVMDTVGNGQLGLPDLPDLEVCVQGGKNYNLQDVDAFLRNTTLYLLQNGEVIKDGDTLDGPFNVKWRARVRKMSLIDPPRRMLRLFPEDGTQPPAVLMQDRGG